MTTKSGIKEEVLEEAIFKVVSEIEGEDDREVALTSIVDVMGVVYDLPPNELDDFQNRIFKRLSEI